jgi:anti-sigma factor RsiW
MTTEVLQHPTEDQLAAYALAHEGESVGSHLSECPACSRYVHEIDMARRALAAIPEEDVPDEVAHRILSHQPVGRDAKPGIWGRFGAWYQSPFVIGLSVILASIFFLLFYLYVTH